MTQPAWVAPVGEVVPSLELGTKDSNQKPRWHTCRCVRSLPELGTYSGWRRCRGCGHLMGAWGTTLLPLAPPKYGPYHRRVA